MDDMRRETMWGLIKRDLGEFVTTLKDDAAGTLKAAISFGEDVESYESDCDQGGDTVRPRGRNIEEVASAALRSLRADISTYNKDVTEGERDSYTSFMRTFDLGARTKEIATLLKEDPVVTGIHTDLVPEQVTYDDFWTRYFFRSERIQKGRAGGISFPHDDEDDDEFGWGEDDQDDASSEGADGAHEEPMDASDDGSEQSSAGDSYHGQVAGRRAPGGQASRRRNVLLVARAGAGGIGGGETTSEPFVKVTAEIARLREALRRLEEERAAERGMAMKKVGGVRGAGVAASREGQEDPSAVSVGDEEGVIGALKRERDAAIAEVEDLTTRLRQAESERDQAIVGAASAQSDIPYSRPVEDAKLREKLEASEARAAAAEERAKQEAAGRAAAEAASAELARASAEGAGDGAGAAMANEMARLKAAFREERAQHENMLLESRKAATEAVEAALSSADADREEACAEVKRRMMTEGKKKDEELAVLRSQVGKRTNVSVAETIALKKQVVELQRVIEAEEQATLEANRYAKQMAESVKQLSFELTQQPGKISDIEPHGYPMDPRPLPFDVPYPRILRGGCSGSGSSIGSEREEVRVLQATAEASRASAAGYLSVSAPANRTGAIATAGRGSHPRSDVSGGGAGGDDTDGWGDEEDDRSTAVSTNSSAVVVDHPPREDQEHEHRVVGANENVQSSATESDADAPTVADLSRVRPGAGLSDGGIGGDHRRSSGLDDELKQGHGSESSVRDVGDDGHKDGEGDDGWDGWD